MTTRALHAVWSDPRGGEALDAGDRVFPIDELLTMIMGVYRWQEFHGPISLYADSRSTAYLERTGLLGMYDEVDTAEIDAIDRGVFDPHTYFSLPKLVALRAAGAPVTVLDLDLFLRQPLPVVSPDSFVFAHWETLNPKYYPPVEDIDAHRLIPLEGFDDRAFACNTAVASFGSALHVEMYTDLALSFAAENKPLDPDVKLASVLFMEQRLVHHAARKTQTALIPVHKDVWDTTNGQWKGSDPHQLFHHTWGEKKRRLGSREDYDIWCRGLAEDLTRAYPTAGTVLARHPELARILP